MRTRILKVARDAISGRFVSHTDAHRWPATTVTETYRIVPRCVRGERVKSGKKR